MHTNLGYIVVLSTIFVAASSQPASQPYIIFPQQSLPIPEGRAALSTAARVSAAQSVERFTPGMGKEISPSRQNFFIALLIIPL